MKYVLSAETTSLLSRMKEKDAIPQNIEFSRVGQFYFSNIYVSKDEYIISDKVQTGVDRKVEIAFLKSLSEFAERRAFEVWVLNHSEYKEFGTDGFAAFPKMINNSKKLARQAALFEAVERYYWANWWDKGGGGCCERGASELNPVKDLIKGIDGSTPIEKIWELRHIESKYEAEVLIYFCKLKNAGYISGGAAGLINCESVKVRAFSEMLRHSLALERINLNEYPHKNYYEKRLIYFGNGEGNHLVEARLGVSERPIIKFSDIEYDDLVSHPLDELFDVYKCQFKHQPIFIGGPIERLCL